MLAPFSGLGVGVYAVYERCVTSTFSLSLAAGRIVSPLDSQQTDSARNGVSPSLILPFSVGTFRHRPQIIPNPPFLGSNVLPTEVLECLWFFTDSFSIFVSLDFHLLLSHVGIPENSQTDLL